MPAGAGDLTLAGAITTSVPVKHLTFSVAARGIAERGVLAALRAAPGRPGNAVPLAHSAVTGATAAQPGRFQLSVHGPDVVAAAGAGAPAADLTLTVSGTGSGGAPLSGSVHVRMPIAPGFTPAAPPIVTLVVPVTAPPAELPSTTGVPADLAGLVAPTGRISALLNAVTAGLGMGNGRSAVTLEIDPALVNRLCGAAGCGSVHPAEPDVPRDVADNARSLLTRISTLAQTVGVSLAALPYGDADIDALVSTGHRDVATRLLTQTSELADELGGAAATQQPAIPVGGTLTAKTLDVLAQLGIRTVVLNQSAAPPDPAVTLRATPTAVGTVTTPDGPVTTLSTDPVLQQLLSTADAGAPSAASPLEDILAETATLSAELPNDTANQRAVVLVAPRLWAASAPYIAGLIGGLGQDSWITPGSAVAASALHPLARVPHLLPAPKSLSHSLISAGEILRAKVDTASRLFATVSVQAAVGAPLRDALDRSYSSWWQNDPAPATALQNAVSASVDRVLGGIGLSHASSVLVTGSSGKLPFILVNRLPYPVVLRVALEPVTASRVQPTHRDVALPAATSGRGEQRVQDSLQVVSRTSGRFPVRLQLETLDGAALGAADEVRVTSHNYGGLAVGITASALFVLVATLILRAIRALRRFHRNRRGTGSFAPAA